MRKILHIVNGKLFVIFIILISVSCAKKEIIIENIVSSPDIFLIDRPKFSAINFDIINEKKCYDEKNFISLSDRLNFCREAVEKYEEMITLYMRWKSEIR